MEVHTRRASADEYLRDYILRLFDDASGIRGLNSPCSLARNHVFCPGGQQEGSRWQAKNERSHRIASSSKPAPAGAAESFIRALPPLPGRRCEMMRDRRLRASRLPPATLISRLRRDAEARFDKVGRG